MDVCGEALAPVAYLLQEDVVELLRSAVGGGDFEPSVELAGIDGLPGEQRPDLVEARVEFVTRDQKPPAYVCRVRLVGGGPAVVDGEVPEVGQHRNRETRGKAVAPNLERWRRIRVYADAGLLGFDEELSLTGEPQLIVGPLVDPLLADLDRRFLDHLAKRELMLSGIEDVPSERREQGRDEIRARLRLVIRSADIVALVALERGNQPGNLSTRLRLRRRIAHDDRRRRDSRRSRIFSQIALSCAHSFGESPI